MNIAEPGMYFMAFDICSRSGLVRSYGGSTSFFAKSPYRFIAAAQFHILINSAEGSLLLHSLAFLWFVDIFEDAIWLCEMTPHCSFHLAFQKLAILSIALLLRFWSYILFRGIFLHFDFLSIFWLSCRFCVSCCCESFFGHIYSFHYHCNSRQRAILIDLYFYRFGDGRQWVLWYAGWTFVSESVRSSGLRCHAMPPHCFAITDNTQMSNKCISSALSIWRGMTAAVTGSAGKALRDPQNKPAYSLASRPTSATSPCLSRHYLLAISGGLEPVAPRGRIAGWQCDSHSGILALPFTGPHGWGQQTAFNFSL